MMDGYFSKATSEEAKKVLENLIKRSSRAKGNMFVDTMISPSYTSAIAQIVQLPSPSGTENNMIIFEFDKNNPDNLKEIIDNISLAKAGDYDVCVFGSSVRTIKAENGIHIWIRDLDDANANLMILLSYILLGHPDWLRGYIQIFNVCVEAKYQETKNKMKELVLSGRLPITEKNIQILSREAGLTIIGVKEEQLRHESLELFAGY
jgi:hypothetical protein